MSDILPKPFTKEGLLHLLEKHLNHLKKHPNPTLTHIKEEDSLLHSPQKPHTPSSATWPSTNSPQTSTAPGDPSEHHYAGAAAMFAAAGGINPNGVTYAPVVGQRRPLDLGEADLGPQSKKQQTHIFGVPPGMPGQQGMQGMRPR